MPISNGSNNWPKTYWSRPPKRPGVHSRVIVVDRPDPPDVKGPSVPSSPQVTYRSPSPQYDFPRTPSPPPSPSTRRTIVEERIRYDDPPPPRKIRVEDPPMTPPPQINRSITTTRTQFDRQPPMPPPPQSRVMSTRSTRYGRYGPDSVQRSTGYDRYQTGYNYSSQQRETSSGCCGNHLFNSGKAGGDTGCCQGGLFSNKRYPYGAEDYYQMPGDGRHRCCAMVWGIIAGLLLLGLLIGLLAGLLPALQKQNAQTAIASKYANGKMYNGIYYYPVTNPPDVFYLALGPGIPCNQFNNNSATKAPATVTKNTATVTGTPKTAAPVTTRTTLPDCKSVTTAYVQVAGLSVSTTTVSWAQQFPNGAATTPGTSSSFCRLGVLAAAVVGYTSLSGRY